MFSALAVLAVLSQAPDAPDAGAAAQVPAPVTSGGAVEQRTPEATKQTFGEPRAEENLPSPAGANPPTAFLGEWWKKFHPFGYIKTGVFYTFPFSDQQLVGSYGGFRIATARIGTELALTDDITVVASIELGAPNLRPDDPLQGGRIVELRDAYVEYRAFKALHVRVGQFKAPYNAETLLGDGDLPFVTRSVATDGLQPPQAYGPRVGLTLDRQIGLQLSSDRLGGDAFAFRYFVAVVNGNGMNTLNNDNNIVTPVARVEAELLRALTVGVNGYYNIANEGIRPNELRVNQLGWGADLTLRIRGFRALAGFIGRVNTYDTSVLPGDQSMGLYGQLHYVLESIGLEAAVRFSWIEPSTAQGADREWEYTAMIGYRFKKVPLRVIAQYTHRDEEPAATIGNDSIDAMVQATW